MGRWASTEDEMSGGTLTIRRAEDVAYRELGSGGGAVLLRLDTGQYHGLNQIGNLVWGLIGEGTTLSELVERVRSEVVGAPDTLGTEIEHFVHDLAARNLLVLGDHP
jgi:hypothetical protein